MILSFLPENSILWGSRRNVFVPPEESERTEKALESRGRGEEGCEDLVFVTTMRSPVLRYHAEREIKKVVKEINFQESVQAVREQREPVVFEEMYPHAIRHTFCSR